MWVLVACRPETPAPTGAPADPVDSGVVATVPPTDAPAPTGDSGTPGAPEVVPPLGGTSGGDGGADHPAPIAVTVGSAGYRLRAPAGSDAGRAVPLLLVISGVEGADAMMSNVAQTAPLFGLGDALLAVADGRDTDARELEAVLDDVRAAYDVDNDRTWLLSESAGTLAGLAVGLDRRASYFAAYWANDVIAAATPAADADALGFAPWGNAAPGGNLPDAQAIVAGMAAAGYRLPPDAPYSGPGATTHGDPRQFLAAMGFFADKRREAP